MTSYHPLAGSINLFTPANSRQKAIASVDLHPFYMTQLLRSLKLFLVVDSVVTGQFLTSLAHLVSNFGHLLSLDIQRSSRPPWLQVLKSAETFILVPSSSAYALLTPKCDGGFRGCPRVETCSVALVDVDVC